MCAVTNSGQTPLDIAEEEGNEECVQLVSGGGGEDIQLLLVRGIVREATFVSGWGQKCWSPVCMCVDECTYVCMYIQASIQACV